MNIKNTIFCEVKLILVTLAAIFGVMTQVIAQAQNTDTITMLTHLQNGDLLFIGASKTNLSGAIDRVTQTHAATTFDHIGLIERTTADSLFILHAHPQAGSARELLSTYLLSEKTRNRDVVIYRLRVAYQNSIPAAVATAKTLLGLPYNKTYVLSDTSLYCSDFVERAFRESGIFELEPMTFIDPATQETDKFWHNYYLQLNLSVPEGLPGCNPNGMAASEKLEVLGVLSADAY